MLIFYFSSASTVALTTSAVNMLILTLMDGRQLGWVCLGACSTDVVVNALVLFWVTGGGHGTSSSASSVGNPTKGNEQDLPMHNAARPKVFIQDPKGTGFKPIASPSASPRDTTRFDYLPTAQRPPSKLTFVDDMPDTPTLNSPRYPLEARFDQERPIAMERSAAAAAALPIPPAPRRKLIKFFRSNSSSKTRGEHELKVRSINLTCLLSILIEISRSL
jgi:hypothetical protein